MLKGVHRFIEDNLGLGFESRDEFTKAVVRKYLLK